MKTFAISSIIALATVATAQLENIPTCAFACFVGPLTTDGCSALTDFACHCKQGAKLLATVQPCVKGACSAEDQETTIQAVEKTCADAGAPIEIPDTPGATTTIVDPSPSATAVSSTPTPTATITASVTGGEETTSVVVVTPSSEATWSYTSTISASAPLSHHSGNSTASHTSTVSEFTGAAAQATQAAGLLGAAALALLAL